MNDEKLKALTDRANKAASLAKEIEQLKSANRYEHRLQLTKGLDKDNVLPPELLYGIFDLGKTMLIAKKEAELGELLGESQTVKVQPIEDFSIGTLDSSDTWEEPIKC